MRIQDVLCANLKGSSSSGKLHLTDIPVSGFDPCWKRNENPVWSTFPLGLESFQEQQPRAFNYTKFTVTTFTALLEKSFVISPVLGSVELGAT